uniref:Yippee domain-containing protein n=1 Tax=Macrostomum lignano TaxID=282301 RepID=A0A1I8IPM6_9PLAT
RRCQFWTRCDTAALLSNPSLIRLLAIDIMTGCQLITASSVVLFITVLLAVGCESVPGPQRAIISSSGADVCNGVPIPASQQRQGVCGRRLYYLWEGACCWYCRAMRVVKHRPDLLPQLNSGDFRHFNFTECRVDHMLVKRGSSSGSSSSGSSSSGSSGGITSSSAMPK